MIDRLFDVGEPTPAEEPSTLRASPDVRRRLRNEAELARGRHPVSGKPLRPEGGTCNTCTHHVESRYAKTYHKCDLNMTGGPGTDIRVSWPACTLYQERTK